ncbi:hypothetical protein MP638_004006, partial [Amoeboaphelidium occidentale]
MELKQELIKFSNSNADLVTTVLSMESTLKKQSLYSAENHVYDPPPPPTHPKLPPPLLLRSSMLVSTTTCFIKRLDGKDLAVAETIISLQRCKSDSGRKLYSTDQFLYQHNETYVGLIIPLSELKQDYADALFKNGLTIVIDNLWTLEHGIDGDFILKIADGAFSLGKLKACSFVYHYLLQDFDCKDSQLDTKFITRKLDCVMKAQESRETES